MVNSNRKTQHHGINFRTLPYQELNTQRINTKTRKPKTRRQPQKKQHQQIIITDPQHTTRATQIAVNKQEAKQVARLYDRYSYKLVKYFLRLKIIIHVVFIIIIILA